MNSPDLTALRPLTEGFDLLDVSCEVCRSTVSNATVRGALQALLSALVGYRHPHLWVGVETELCETCWLHGDLDEDQAWAVEDQ